MRANMKFVRLVQYALRIVVPILIVRPDVQPGIRIIAIPMMIAMLWDITLCRVIVPDASLFGVRMIRSLFFVNKGENKF